MIDPKYIFSWIVEKSILSASSGRGDLRYPELNEPSKASLPLGGEAWAAHQQLQALN